MLVDFHSHSTLSDGTLSIHEMVAAAERRRYHALAITDHVHPHDDPREVLRPMRLMLGVLQATTRVRLFPGVELTDFRPEEICRAAAEARDAGADVIVVHGECVTMQVAAGTNAAAVRSSGVDILAHPGLIKEEDAAAAAASGVHLELSAREGHCYANGHVYRVACRTGAQLVVDSDAHDEMGLISDARVTAVIRGAGGDDGFVDRVRLEMSPGLLGRIERRAALRGGGPAAEGLAAS